MESYRGTYMRNEIETSFKIQFVRFGISHRNENVEYLGLN